MTAQDHPEPVEPPAFLAPGGEIYCLVHGTMNCDEPWCYRCNNHEMDDFGRCADPRCRATNGPRGSLAASIIQDTKYRWGLYWSTPCPVEAFEYEIGRAMAERFCSVNAMLAAKGLTLPSPSSPAEPPDRAGSGASDPAAPGDRT